MNAKDKHLLLSVKYPHQPYEKLKENYVIFDPAGYMGNPIALARIKAGVAQKELAEGLGVSQAYISADMKIRMSLQRRHCTKLNKY